jgi:hypothetical protein
MPTRRPSGGQRTNAARQERHRQARVQSGKRRYEATIDRGLADYADADADRRGQSRAAWLEATIRAHQETAMSTPTLVALNLDGTGERESEPPMEDNTYYVERLDGTVPWTRKGPEYDDPNRPSAWRECVDACIAAAIEHRGLPRVKHHAHWHEYIKWEIPSREEPEHVALSTGIGEFRVRARRARVGELTSQITALPGAFGIGDLATRANVATSPIVATVAMLYPSPAQPGQYWIQVSRFRYADGTYSGEMDSYPRDATLEQPRTAFAAAAT